MNNFAKIVLISGAFALAATGVNAADVKGNVETTVKVKNVSQEAVGLANKNELNVGAIDGKNTKVGGNVKINVKADSITQKATGLANKNEMNIGSVSE